MPNDFTTAYRPTTTSETPATSIEVPDAASLATFPEDGKVSLDDAYLLRLAASGKKDFVSSCIESPDRTKAKPTTD